MESLSHFIGQLPSVVNLLVGLFSVTSIYCFVKGLYLVATVSAHDQGKRGKKTRYFIAGFILNSFAIITSIVIKSVFNESTPARKILNYSSAAKSGAWDEVIMNSAFAIFIVIGLWNGLKSATKIAKSPAERVQGETDGKLVTSILVSICLINAEIVFEVIKKTLNYKYF